MYNGARERLALRRFNNLNDFLFGSHSSTAEVRKIGWTAAWKRVKKRDLEIVMNNLNTRQMNDVGWITLSRSVRWSRVSEERTLVIFGAIFNGERNKRQRSKIKICSLRSFSWILFSVRSFSVFFSCHGTSASVWKSLLAVVIQLSSALKEEAWER